MKKKNRNIVAGVIVGVALASVAVWFVNRQKESKRKNNGKNKK